jgi:hypothetical protein
MFWKFENFILHFDEEKREIRAPTVFDLKGRILMENIWEQYDR